MEPKDFEISRTKIIVVAGLPNRIGGMGADMRRIVVFVFA